MFCAESNLYRRCFGSHFLVLTACILSLCFPATLARAQEEAAASPTEKEKRIVLREQTVYVPFEKLETVFNKADQGVFLPYKDFLEIWRSGQPVPPPPPPDEPPAATVLRGARYVGEISGEVARFEVTFGIEALKKGWSELLLPLSGVAVESITLTPAGTPADSADSQALFTARKNGYAVIVPAPGKYEAKLTLSVRVAQAPGKKTVRFGLPSAAVSRLELVIPEEQVRVDVQPSLTVARTEAEADRTRVIAFLGNSGTVEVSWMPAIGKAGEGGAVVSATQSVHTDLGERILKIETTIDYAVRRGEIDTFRTAIPSGTRLLSVKGENIREWTEDEGKTVLSVRLHAPIKATYRLSLSFERILEDTPATLDVPFPRALDVLHEAGDMALSHDDALNVRVTNTQGLSQLDPEDVPAPLRPHLGTGFRYFAHPLALTLAVERILPVVRASSTSVVTLGVEEDVWVGWIDYEITKAGLFELQFSVPTLWSVASVGDDQKVEVLPPSDAGGIRTITVSLKAKAFGNFRLPFRLTRDGTASPGELNLTPPRVLGVTRDRGLFGVSAPRAIEVTTIERERMVDASEDELFASGIMGQLSTEAGIPNSYRYREQPASVRLQLKAKNREVNVLAQHLIEVGDGQIQVTHLLDYDVLYAPADTLRFRAPSTLDELLQVEAKQKTQVTKQPGDQGQTLWEVSFTPPVLGPRTLTLTHSHSLKAFQAGSEDYAVLFVHAVDASTEGFIAVRKEGTLEIVPTMTELEAIDTGDLPDKLRGRRQIYAAFRYFTGNPSLTLRLTRHEYQRLATTAIQHLHMKCVLTGERRLITLATLMVQNTERQYLQLQLPAENIVTLNVAGKNQNVKKASGGEASLVEIPHSAGPSGTFPVILRYEEPLASSDMGSFGSVALKTLEILEDIPISQVSVDLYLPPEYLYMAWGGNIHPRRAHETDVWSRFKALLSGSRNVNAVQRQMRAAPEMPAGVGVQVELPTEGLELHSFETFAPVGTLSFIYSGRRLFGFIDFLAFVAAAVGTYFLLTYRPYWTRLRLGVLAVLVPLVISWFVGGATTEVFLSLCFGAVVICVVFLFKHLKGVYGEYRTARLDLAPDPFLEDAGEEAKNTSSPEAEEASAEEDEGGETEEEEEPPAAEEDDSEADQKTEATSEPEPSSKKRKARKKKKES